MDSPDDSALIADEQTLPFTKVLWSIIGLWACYFLFITLRSVLIEGTDLVEMALRRLVVVLAGVVVTLLAWLLLRPFDRRAMTLKISAAAAIMLPASLALAVINQQTFTGMAPPNFIEMSEHIQIGLARLRLASESPTETSVGIFIIESLLERAGLLDADLAKRYLVKHGATFQRGEETVRFRFADIFRQMTLVFVFKKTRTLKSLDFFQSTGAGRRGGKNCRCSASQF